MNEDQYCVLDLETTVKNKIGKNKASPHNPLNKIVMGGLNHSTHGIKIYGGTIPIYSDTKILVAHNFPFEDAWVRRSCSRPVGGTEEPIAAWNKLFVWDTAVAEYLLTGQQSKFPSLDDCASKYGGTLKDDRIKAMWDEGVQTEDIPKEMLEPYLRADLENTMKVFKSQLLEATTKGMMPLMRSQMEACRAISMMMHNGMFFRQDVANIHMAALKHRIDVTKGSLGLMINPRYLTLLGFPSGYTLDVSSPKDLSILFFGGSVQVESEQVVGKYKNGKDKTKKVKTSIRVPGYGLAPTAYGSKLGASGYFSVDATVLKNIANLSTHGESATIAKTILDLRDDEKQLNTYFEPTVELLFPGSLIHHNLNQTLTTTGRLSASNPNLQNVTSGSDSLIKGCYQSRFGDDGVIIEADYKQLEMVALAYLSGDRQLTYDINHGVDIHTELYREMFGRAPTKEERTPFKRFSFGLVYGAGPKSLAEQAGTDLATAKRFVKVWAKRYPGTVEWWKKTRKQVHDNRVYSGGLDPEGRAVATSEYISVTGRRLIFKDYWNQKWDGTFGADFSPTEIKNYPVQSLATGDIVPHVLGKLYRALINDPDLRDKCLMINTVHDSVMFDCRREVLEKALPLIQQVMTDVPHYMREDFGIEDFDVVFNVSISYGSSWADQKTEYNP